MIDEKFITIIAGRLLIQSNRKIGQDALFCEELSEHHPKFPAEVGYLSCFQLHSQDPVQKHWVTMGNTWRELGGVFRP